MSGSRFVRGLLRRLAPRWVHNALAQGLIDIERFHPPRSLAAPPGQRILVLAPHPDDESIGCGGVLCHYAQAGIPVMVAVLSDGRQGDPQLRALPSGDPRRASGEQALVALRRAEAEAALDILQVDHRVFLAAPDGQLHEAAGAVATRLAGIIDEWRPDTVLLPFMTDRHSDHFATNRCLIGAVQSLRAPWLSGLHCMAYEIWSPIYANLHVDITAVMARKREALLCYASQLRFDDYVAAVEGLNRFRAISGHSGGQYAEAFFHAPLDVYRRLFDKMQL